MNIDNRSQDRNVRSLAQWSRAVEEEGVFGNRRGRRGEVARVKGGVSDSEMG